MHSSENIGVRNWVHRFESRCVTYEITLLASQIVNTLHKVIKTIIVIQSINYIPQVNDISLYLYRTEADIYAFGGIRTRNLSKRETADPRFRPRCHWDQLVFRTYIHTYIHTHTHTYIHTYMDEYISYINKSSSAEKFHLISFNSYTPKVNF